jgi:hypothetical protein
MLVVLWRRNDGKPNAFFLACGDIVSSILDYLSSVSLKLTR